MIKVGALNFFHQIFFLWVFSSSESDKNYLDKGRISSINDSDLIEVRNLSEENAFIVFISNLSPVIIPSDNITSVSEKYYDSHKKFATIKKQLKNSKMRVIIQQKTSQEILIMYF